MKKISILAAALAVLLAGGAYAASPGLISYQGTLRKDGRLFSGTVAMEFSITDASGATEYWNSGSTAVVVSTGLFRYQLGTPNEAAFAAIPWKDITPYVRMSLDGGLLQPEPLYSSAYSLHAVTAEASTGTFTVNNGDLKLAGAAGTKGIVYTDNTVQRTAPGWAASGQHAVLTGTGYAGLGLAGPQTRLDVQAAAADSYSQFWRNSGGVIVASMSAGGTLYADAAGLRNIAGDGLGSHLATQDLNMAGRRITSAPSVGLNAAVSLSSSSAAHYGGLYVSSHVYLAAGAKYYGDGSQLSNVSGSDDLGDHTLTQNLVLGANWVSGDGGGEGLAVDAAGNVGVGQAAPGARLDVRGDAGGYAQIWRDDGGVVQASMSATGVLYAAASGLRGLPAGALGDGLGSHALAQNLVAGTFWYSGDGGNEGLFVDAGGNVGVSTNAPAARLDVRGAVAGNSQIWRSAAGAAVATMTAAGVLHADGSGLINIAEADPVFAAHPANAILAGERAAWNGAAAWGDHAAAGYARLAQANTFASSATFSIQHATRPGVLVSSGLVVADGSVGIGTASPLQRLDVNGAVRVGNSTMDVPGSIRYNGSSFEGYNGSDWVALNGSYVTDNSALWAVGPDTVYTVGAASGVAIGWSPDAGNSKLLVRANTDDDTENAFLAENFTGFPIFKVRNDGNIGAGTEIPEARLDVLTVPAAAYSQIWRNQFGVIMASVSANGVIYADGAGLRNIAGDGLGGHTASQAFNLAGNQILNASSVTVTGAQGVGAPRLALAPGVALSSAAAAVYGGVYVSTHVYLPAGAKYYGDGSALSNVGGQDNLGDHTLTQDLVTGSNWITGDGDPEGFYVDSAGNAGVGTAAPAARLDVLGDQGGYIQFWRNNGGLAQATMTAAGVLHADGSALRNLSASALTAGALPDARLSANVPLLGAAANAFTGSLSVAAAGGLTAPRLALAPGVAVSSSAPAFNGGVYLSSNVYVVGIASAAKYYGDGSALTGIGGSDGLGDHTLTQNLVVGSNWLSGDGGDEGLLVDASGNVGVGQDAPGARLDVRGDSGGYSQIWRDSSGVIFASMTAAGVLYADASQLRNLPAGAGGGDDLGDHTMIQNLVAGSNWLSGDGGDEGVSVNSAGNVGIGVNPATARLEVNDGDASALTSGVKFTDFSCSGFDKLTVDGSGNLVCSVDQTGGGTGNIVDTLAQTLSAGTDAGGLGMVNLGNVALGLGTAGTRLDVQAGAGGYAQFWRDSGGVIVASMTDAGVLYADASQLRGLPPGGGAEADPVFTAHSAFGISGSDISGWNAAFGWGDHASAGYASKSADQTLSGANTFSSGAMFTREDAALPGVYVSSGLVVAAGSLGVGTAGPLQRLDVNGGIRLGNTTASVPGSMRYSGGNFEGYNGAAWVALNGSYTADSSALWSVTTDTVYTVGVDSGVAIGSNAAGANKLRVTGADNGSGSNAFLAESQDQTALLVVRNDGGVGVGTVNPATRLDVTADGAGYSQIWRDSGGVVTSSMSDSGVLYADASGLRNLPAGGGGSDDLGNHTATLPLNLAGQWLINVSTVVGSPAEPGIAFSTSLFVGGDIFAAGGAMFSNGPLVIGETIPAASLHISSAAGYAGDMVMVSTGVSPVIRMTGAGGVYAARFYGDGSGLFNVPAGVGMANPAIAHFDMNTYNIVNVASITPVSTLYINGGLLSTSLAGAGDRCVYAAADGTIGVKATDCGAGGGGSMDNPSTADLDMGGHNIVNAASISISSRVALGNSAAAPSPSGVLLVENTFAGTEIGTENFGVAAMATVDRAPGDPVPAPEAAVVGAELHGSAVGAGDFPSVIGVRTGALVEGAGTVENVSGIFVQNYQSAGTINEHYGIVIIPPDTVGGTIVNNTALLIEDHSTQGSGDNFNLVSRGADSINIFEGAVAVQGKLALPSKDKATLQAYVPDMEGEVYYCSDCSPKKLVVSTGTAAGNFAAVDGGTFQ